MFMIINYKHMYVFYIKYIIYIYIYIYIYFSFNWSKTVRFWHQHIHSKFFSGWKNIPQKSSRFYYHLEVRRKRDGSDRKRLALWFGRLLVPQVDEALGGCFCFQQGSHTQRVKHYWYTSWPDHKTPDSAQPLLQLMLDVEEDRLASAGRGPVVVHCR